MCARKYAEAVLILKDDRLSGLDQEMFVVGAEDTNSNHSAFRTFVIKKLEIEVDLAFSASTRKRRMHYYHGLLLLPSNDLNATNGILKKSGSSNAGNRFVLTGAGCAPA